MGLGQQRVKSWARFQVNSVRSELMTKLHGYEMALSILGEFQFRDFSLVRELRFYEEMGGDRPIQNLEMIIESEKREPNYRLCLKFSGVSNLRLSNFGGGETRIAGFDVVDVTDRQWEKISWEVLDYEDGDLAFYAFTGQVVSVTALNS